MIELKSMRIVVPKDLYFKIKNGGYYDMVSEMATVGLYKEIALKEELLERLTLERCGKSDT